MAYPYPRMLFVCPLVAACGGGSEAGSGADAGSSLECGRIADLPFVLPIRGETELDSSHQVTFDRDGSLVVSFAGTSADNPVYRCAQLARLAPDGSELWRHDYDPFTVPVDEYRGCPGSWTAIALGGDGSIATIGALEHDDRAQSRAIVVRKHDGEGNALWTDLELSDPSGDTGAVAGDVASDVNGAVVAVGSVWPTPWVRRLSASGAVRWTWTGSDMDAAAAVEVDQDGNAVVGIYTHQEGPVLPYRLTGFDRAGRQTPIHELELLASMVIRKDTLAITSEGASIIAAGTLRKIARTGEIMWEQAIDDLDLEDRSGCSIEVGGSPMAMAIGPDGSIYLALPAEIEHRLDPEFPSSKELTVLARYSAEGELLSEHVHETARVDHLAVGPNGEIAISIGSLLLVAPPLPPP
jgi:hypothetical protein